MDANLESHSKEELISLLEDIILEHESLIEALLDACEDVRPAKIPTAIVDVLANVVDVENFQEFLKDRAESKENE